jgi:type VI secretion system secreted protein Hcp
MELAMHTELNRLIVASAATLVLATPALGNAAVDAFLDIKGIPGESQDARHKDEIEILSWSMGASQVSPSAGSRLSASRPCVKDISFSKTLDKASPLLFASAVSGMHIPQATLTLRKAGGNQAEYLIMKLENIIVSSYQSGGGSADVVPTDSFSLNFGRVTFSYSPQKPDGTLDSPVTAVIQGGC